MVVSLITAPFYKFMPFSCVFIRISTHFSSKQAGTLLRASDCHSLCRQHVQLGKSPPIIRVSNVITGCPHPPASMARIISLQGQGRAYLRGKSFVNAFSPNYSYHRACR